ncbi:MAG: hypothetical protein ACK55Z_35505, partial [bacterium]
FNLYLNELSNPRTSPTVKACLAKATNLAVDINICIVYCSRANWDMSSYLLGKKLWLRTRRCITALRIPYSANRVWVSNAD